MNKLQAPDFLATRTVPEGTAQHILAIQPATSFEYRYESTRRAARVIHVERGALEARSGRPAEVRAFRAGVSPTDNPTRGGFFTSPDVVELIAEAHIAIEGGMSGDLITCRSYGSYAGLKVTLSIYRVNPDGTIELILKEDIRDADEHTFSIP